MAFIGPGAGHLHNPQEREAERALKVLHYAQRDLLMLRSKLRLILLNKDGTASKTALAKELMDVLGLAECMQIMGPTCITR